MYSIIITVIALFLLAFSAFIMWKCGIVKKIFLKLGLSKSKVGTNWTAFSWTSCLEKMSVKADIVFFGDSIIRGGNFHEVFSSYKIVNLGSSGDDLYGMIYRINTVKAVSPKKVFLLGGINGLTNMNWKKYSEVYEELLRKLKIALPDTKIFVHSLLPISKEKEKSICKNTTIIKFNSAIKCIALKHNVDYIDLYEQYVCESVLNPLLTVDGIHLKVEAYEIWFNELKKIID